MGISVKFIHYFLMLLLSFAVVSSLRSVGVILVVAMLITPASTALLLSNKLKNVIILSGLFGLLAAILGLVLAIVLNTTPGPAMCIVATLIYFLAAIFAPEKGILSRYRTRLGQRRKIEQEDIIKLAVKQEPGKRIPSTLLSEKLGLSASTIGKHLQVLKLDGMVQLQGTEMILTIKGMENAEQLVRAHRLWETYLVDKAGLTEKQIHQDAERLEHLLPEDMVDEVDKVLGYPQNDPHGSPIPQKRNRPLNPLLKLKPRARAKIATKQISNDVESELWELGLMPNTAFQIDTINESAILIKIGQKKVSIPAELAKQINVQV